MDGQARPSSLPRLIQKSNLTDVFEKCGQLSLKVDEKLATGLVKQGPVSR